jgi:hypothetical protein
MANFLIKILKNLTSKVIKVFYTRTLCVRKFNLVIGVSLEFQKLNFLHGRTLCLGTSLSLKHCIPDHCWGLYWWKLYTEMDH